MVHATADLRRLGHHERQPLTSERVRRTLVTALALTAALGAGRALRAQTAPARRVIALPRGDVFQPLLADPKEPELLGSVLKTWRALDTHIAAVEFGEPVGIVRWPGTRTGDGVQLGISAAIFAQFDLDTPSNDLLNTDFMIGVPLTVREGDWSGRLRVYHQSSHLGDTVLIAGHPERLNLSFEALEVLVSRDVGPLRMYGGGEVLLRRDPGSLHRAMAHLGAQIASAPVVRLNGFGRGRVVLGVDAKLPGNDRFAVGTSVRAGLEFTAPGAAPRRWGVLLHFYVGPVPYGQYYVEDITSLGIGLHIAP